MMELWGLYKTLYTHLHIWHLWKRCFLVHKLRGFGFGLPLPISGYLPVHPNLVTQQPKDRNQFPFLDNSSFLPSPLILLSSNFIYYLYVALEVISNNLSFSHGAHVCVIQHPFLEYNQFYQINMRNGGKFWSTNKRYRVFKNIAQFKG